MSKKRPASGSQASPSKSAPLTPTQHDWLTPISQAEPCGPDLEFDQDFIILFTRAEPKPAVQYGSFVGTPEPTDWGAIDQDCRQLMMRCKDIRVAVLFTRCRARLSGAAGLAEGLGLLVAWLDAFTDSIHPRLDLEDDPQAVQEVRRNALQALTDGAGLLADIREIVLTRSALRRLQIRDVERAFAVPRLPDALAPDSVEHQLRDLRTATPEVLSGFDLAQDHLAKIETWCVQQLGDYQPDLTPLARLLARLGQASSNTKGKTAMTMSDHEGEDEELESIQQTSNAEARIGSLEAPRHADDTQPAQPDEKNISQANRPIPRALDRQSALDLICRARQWFEVNEPSSPVPVLLQRAEQFVGKPYAQAIKAIPADLLAQWSNAEEG